MSNRLKILFAAVQLTSFLIYLCEIIAAGLSPGGNILRVPDDMDVILRRKIIIRRCQKVLYIGDSNCIISEIGYDSI